MKRLRGDSEGEREEEGERRRDTDREKDFYNNEMKRCEEVTVLLTDEHLRGFL